MVAKDSIPSAEYLRECFDYDPETGVLTWRTRPVHHFQNAKDQAAWNGLRAGKRAGSRNPNWRYERIGINGTGYGMHRVIWALQTGRWPNQIDHINRDGRDNRWSNLREATHQQNKWNRSRPDRELPRGVRRARQGPRFTAQVKRNHQAVHLGSFDTPEEAHAAWLAAVSEERGEFFKPD